YRFVPYIGYKFSDNVVLNTEIEFEHGGSDDSSDPELSGGYVKVEFMYLDFLINENLNARVGNFLVPMGLINERHEPTLFTTVQRPQTSRYLLPSTWHESGGMVFGNIGDDISYKFAVVTAIDTLDPADKAKDGSKWLRNGRGGSFKQKNPEFAGVARVDYTGVKGLFIGASAYYGSSGIGAESKTVMADVHGDYKIAGFRAYGVYTQTKRSKAATISSTAVSDAKGGFLNLSYDLLSTMGSTYSLPVFAQYESVNPQAKFADGTSFDSVNTTSIGINFFPQEQVVLKADYAMADNDYSNTGKELNTFSLSMGFIF
ncbi:MAG: porin, partial [Campylobacterota bacterium]|nr:porin [Campylobacterota bacterium]